MRRIIHNTLRRLLARNARPEQVEHDADWMARIGRENSPARCRQHVLKRANDMSAEAIVARINDSLHREVLQQGGL